MGYPHRSHIIKVCRNRSFWSLNDFIVNKSPKAHFTQMKYEIIGKNTNESSTYIYKL